MNKPLVSILIPYYNDARFLPEAIEGVLNSTYKNFELILLNHATTDNCREIAHSYKDERIKHIDMDKNLGAGSGVLLTSFLKIAQGKYIKMLCADDVIRKEGLEILVNYMENNPNKDFAFGDVEYIDINGKDLKNSWFKNRKGFSINDTEVDLIKKYMCGISMLPYIGVIAKKEIFNDININKTFVMMFDMSLWYSLLCKKYKIGFIEDIVSNYRISEYQLCNPKNLKKALKMSCFENTSFWKYLLSIDDIDFCKKIFSDSGYISKLKNSNDIYFIILQYMFTKNKVDWYKPYAYELLNEMLNDDSKRKYLEEHFGYGIKEFRDDIFFKDDNKRTSFLKNYKSNLVEKGSLDLSLVDIMFLILRKIFNQITFRYVRNIIKQKRNRGYSL